MWCTGGSPRDTHPLLIFCTILGPMFRTMFCINIGAHSQNHFSHNICAHICSEQYSHLYRQYASTVCKFHTILEPLCMFHTLYILHSQIQKQICWRNMGTMLIPYLPCSQQYEYLAIYSNKYVSDFPHIPNYRSLYSEQC